MNEMVKTGAQDIMETVVSKGDLSKLTSDERSKFYFEICNSMGLNPLTRPFEYLVLNGRTVMYARKDAADQLRKINGVSIEITEQRVEGDLFLVTVRASDKSGRIDSDMGVTVIPKGGANEIKANMILKAITKAKRRVTLSICGLGFLDESEIEDIVKEPKKRGAVRTVTSADIPSLTGEIDSPQSHAHPTEAEQSAPAQRVTAGADNEMLDEIKRALLNTAEGGMAALGIEWKALHVNYRRKLSEFKDTVLKPLAEQADLQAAAQSAK